MSEQTTQADPVKWPQLTVKEWALVFASLRYAHRDFFMTSTRESLAAIIRKLEEAVRGIPPEGRGDA